MPGRRHWKKKGRTRRAHAAGRPARRLTLESLEPRTLLSGSGHGLFPGELFPVGADPQSVAVGDFDGDGKLDLVTSNTNPLSNSVSVLLGRGDGTFAARTDYPAGADPRSAAVGDFDGDGKLDLVTAAARNNNVSVRLGRGDGTFAAQATYAVGASPRSVSAGDFDRDGVPDLVAANYDGNSVSVLLGRGDGTFAARANYAVGSRPSSVAAGDFDGDGALDLVAANAASDSVSVLLSRGDGTFAAQATYAVGASPRSVSVGDFDRDGVPDLVAANYDGNSVSVLLGRGDGTFAARANYAVGANTQSVAVGDFDGDGSLDLVAANAGSVSDSNINNNGVSVLLGRGDGTFMPRANYATWSFPVSVSVGDFDGDGVLDLVTVNPLSNNSVSMLWGHGDGTFAARTTYGTGSKYSSVTMGDLDGDGVVDLVVANSRGNSVSVLRGRGDGTFMPQADYGVGSNPQSLSMGDLDGDGVLDLAVANSDGESVSVLRGRGDGTFLPRLDHAVGSRPSSVAVGDFDGDGKLDLVTANGNPLSDSVSVLVGRGDGTFAARVNYAVGSRPSSVAAGDFDGDGSPDLAVANSGGSSVSVLLGRGDGTFAARTDYAVGAGPRSVGVGDFNGDGALDLVVANSDSNTVSVLLGRGDGTFAARANYAVGGSTQSVAVGDFDRDGVLDLITTNLLGGSVSVLLGGGDGTFAALANYAAGSEPSSVSAGDLNGDGSLDLVVTSRLSDGFISVLLNRVGFGSPTTADLVVTSVSSEPHLVALGEKLRLSYTVRNAGTGVAPGRWVDSLFLSRDSRFDNSDVRLSRVVHDGGLGPGDSDARVLDVTIPFVEGFSPGEWFLLVRADAGGDVAEANEANNQGGFALTIEQQVQSLTPGQPFEGTIRAGEVRYFSVEVAPGRSLALALTGLPTDGVVNLFVKRDSLPGRTSYDRAGTRPFAAEQYVVTAPQTDTRTFYVMVDARTLNSSPVTFQLAASAPAFGIRVTRFGTAGNTGDYTIHAVGSGFDDTITARLTTAQGFSLPARSHAYASETELFASFDLRGVTPGAYDVTFTNGAGGVVTIPQGLTVVQAAAPNAVIPRVVAPAAVRRGRAFQFTVEWENTSPFNDAPIPLLTVEATVPFGLALGDASLGTRYTFLGVNTQGGPAGTLRPGQRESLTFWSYSDTEPGNYAVFVDREFEDTSAPFDWASAISPVAPAAMSDDDLHAASQLLGQEYGVDAGAYLRLLSDAASRTWGDARNPKLLLQEAVLRAWSRLPSGLRGVVESGGPRPDGGYVVTATETASGRSFVTRTDRFDLFDLPDLPDGSYRLSVEGQVLKRPAEGLVRLAGGQSTGPVVLSVAPAPVVTLQVDLLDGDPIGDASVLLQANGEVVAKGQTDAAGVVTLSPVGPGAYALVVVLPGGGFRRYENLVVPEDVPALIEVDLASAVAVGSLPGETTLYPVLVATETVTEVIHAVRSGDAFEFRAPAGAYRLLVYDGNGTLVKDAGNYSLEAGQVIDVGRVDVGGLAGKATTGGLAAPSTFRGPGGFVWFADPGVGEYLSDGPPSVLAILDIINIAAGDPDLVEALLAPVVIKATDLVRGSEYADVVELFVAGGGYAFFHDGDQTIEVGGGSNPGFRKHSATGVWLYKLLERAAAALNPRIVRGELSLGCGESQSFDLRALIPADDLEGQRYLYQDGNMPDLGPGLELDFTETLAGGVGHYGTPPNHRSTPDWRRVDAGKARLERGRDGEYRLELEGVKLHVHDAFDLWPGSLGEGLATRYATTILAFLEINGNAGDVVFDAVWANTDTVKMDLFIHEACDEDDHPDPPDDEADIRRPASFDPNDIIGPAGHGPGNHVVATGVMPYTIRFENDAGKATGPAAVVTVTQALDPDLDWTTFRLGDMGFGNTVVEVPSDAAFFQARVDLTATRGVFVDVSAGIDAATGVVRWEFVAVDPATGDLPEDPLVGFLPPNAVGPEGEGFVTYTIRPKAGAATGDRADAVASIVFDVNEPIVTPSIFHTFDSDGPTSQVAALPGESVSGFAVRWAGADDPGGSGVAGFTVYVSVDGGPFNPWLTDTTQTQAAYPGQVGHRYAFYTVARDLVGHFEAGPAAPDTSTLVTSTAVTTATSVQSDRNPSSAGDPVTFTATVTATSGTEKPTGSVQFRIDGSTFGPAVALVNGVATSNPIRTLPAGHSTVTADFIDVDGRYAPSTGTLAGGQTVNPTAALAASQTSLTSSPAGPVYGQSLTVTVTVTPKSGSGTPTGSVQFLVNGSALGPAVILVNGAATSQAVADLGAGSHLVSAVYSGDASFATSAGDMTATVARAPLTVTADAATRTYGQANPMFTASYRGFVLGQGPGALGGSLTFATPATAGSHVGSYRVTPAGLTSDNYAITFTDGTLDVTPAPLTVRANDAARIFGAAVPTLTASYVGFVNGDGPSRLATPVRLRTSAAALSPAGSYPITADSASSPDYAIRFLPGTLVVTPPRHALDGARTAFVATLYRDLLGRDPEPTGLRSWVQRAAAGVSTRLITMAFWRSKEHRILQNEHRGTGTKPQTAWTNAVQAARRVLMARTASPGGPRTLLRSTGSGLKVP